MPTKQNGAGQQQEYIPAGNGDKSGEFIGNNTTSAEDYKLKSLGINSEETPKNINKIINDKNNTISKLQKIKDDLIVKENEHISIEERDRLRELKNRYEKDLAYYNTLIERYKYPNHKIFNQNDLYTNDATGSMFGNYEIYDKNLEERNKYFEKSFNDLEKNLGENKNYFFEEALEKYTQPEYYEKINKNLISEDIVNSNLQQISDRIHDGINEFETPENMVVYRSDTEDWVTRNNLSNFNWDDLVGKEIIEKQFLSTSLDKSISKDFDAHRTQQKHQGILFEIKIPNGKGFGIPTWKYGSYEPEQEYLLNSNSKYKITNVRNENGKIIVEQEMIK